MNSTARTAMAVRSGFQRVTSRAAGRKTRLASNVLKSW